MSQDVEEPRRCSICPNPGFGNNYHCWSCRACKQFFKRTLDHHIKHKCRRVNKCFENLTPNSVTPRCRKCRFDKCLENGMFMTLEQVAGLAAYDAGSIGATIGELRYLDERRIAKLNRKMCFENPSLTDIVRRTKVQIQEQGPCYIKTTEDWQFLQLITCVEFLMELDFMRKMAVEEQIILLKAFTGKVALLFTCYNSFCLKSAQMITPGRQEIAPNHFTQMGVSPKFLEKVRSRLTGKFIHLDINEEEFLLVLGVLVCDHVDGLSEGTKTIVEKKRQLYASALYEYCQLQHKEKGQTRYVDLLSIACTLNLNMQNVLSMSELVKLDMKKKNQPFICKNLHDELI